MRQVILITHASGRQQGAGRERRFAGERRAREPRVEQLAAQAVEQQGVGRERFGLLQRVVVLVQPDAQPPTQKEGGGIHKKREQIGQRDIAQFRFRFGQRFPEEWCFRERPRGSRCGIRGGVTQ